MVKKALFQHRWDVGRKWYPPVCTHFRPWTQFRPRLHIQAISMALGEGCINAKMDVVFANAKRAAGLRSALAPHFAALFVAGSM